MTQTRADGKLATNPRCCQPVCGETRFYRLQMPRRQRPSVTTNHHTLRPARLLWGNRVRVCSPSTASMAGGWLPGVGGSPPCGRESMQGLRFPTSSRPQPRGSILPTAGWELPSAFSRPERWFIDSLSRMFLTQNILTAGANADTGNRLQGNAQTHPNKTLSSRTDQGHVCESWAGKHCSGGGKGRGCPQAVQGPGHRDPGPQLRGHEATLGGTPVPPSSPDTKAPFQGTCGFK